VELKEATLLLIELWRTLNGWNISLLNSVLAAMELSALCMELI
jgi:hypothetical protein